MSELSSGTQLPAFPQADRRNIAAKKKTARKTRRTAPLYFSLKMPFSIRSKILLSHIALFL
jgi:hypothetical protein